METFHIHLQDDVLKIGFNPDRPAKTEHIVKDVIGRLRVMEDNGELIGGPLLKINGPAPLPVCYTLAHHLLDKYRTIAVFDPKTGAYVVAIAQSSTYSCGELIPADDPTDQAITTSPIKVVLCGPPRSGKSCLRQGLKQAILTIANAPYPYVITACPDGEGAWFSEAAQRDPTLARQLKDGYKAKFTPEFAALAAGWVRQTPNPLTLIDVGGKITDENRQIMAQATHAIILSGDPDQIPVWENFCRSVGLTILAQVHSHYGADCDRVVLETPNIITGQVHHLERGEDISSRPMVQALAHHIVQQLPS
ncbi:MAG: CRISPR-associated protein Csx3 [Symploca sp. SIO2G7]|nr:CRISPR-associated protein Csx3 [Symploca sp. SIO2G7]